MTILLSDGSQVKRFDYEIIKSDPLLKKNSDEFFKNEIEFLDSKRCLFVGQREYATVSYDDPYIDFIGSDDATTCHIVLIVDEETNNCSVCHFDGSDLQDGVCDMVNSLIELKQSNLISHSFSLYIVGGFLDDRGTSIGLTVDLFDLLNESEIIFNLKLAIVSELNDIVKNDLHFPIVYGLGYNIKTKKVFMCNRFLDKGPDMSARSARHFSANGNMNIYDPLNHKLIIGPFDYRVYNYIPQCVNLPDDILLKNFSTSPEQEPPYFVKNLRDTFKFMVKHPRPLITYFVDKKPFFYKKQDNGTWLPC